MQVSFYFNSQNLAFFLLNWKPGLIPAFKGKKPPLIPTLTGETYILIPDFENKTWINSFF